jgi:GNAT superfamily N-acetyltransferase
MPFGLDAAAFNRAGGKGAVRVRPLAPTDRARWNELWTGYLAFYKTTLPQAQYDLTFTRYLDPTEPMYAYLAEHKGRAMGLVHIILHRSGWMNGPTCYLQDLFVEPSERGTGMGRALIEHVYDVVKAAGGTRVYWLTQEGNTTARKLYDRIAEAPGFVEYTKSL